MPPIWVLATPRKKRKSPDEIACQYEFTLDEDA